MGLLTHLRQGAPLRASYAPWDDFWFKPPGSPTVAGMRTSPEAAMRLSAVWACIGLRSEALASVPLTLYRRNGAWKEKATDHSLYNRLRWQPNPWQTAYEYEEMAEAFICLRGNFYAQIIEDRSAQVQALIPLHPDRMRVEQASSGQLRYTYRRTDGTEQVFTSAEIHHRRFRTLDGIKGLSPIEYASLTLGIAQAGEAFAANHFSGGAAPPFAIVHPQTLGEDALKNLRKSLKEYEQDEKFLTLEEDVKIHQLGVSARDAQMLEARQYGIEEIARFFNVPMHLLKVNKAGAVSYASVEMSDLDFVMHTIRPEAVRHEQAIRRDLLSESEQDQYFVEYLLDALLRADSAGRAAFYRTMTDVQAITPNEIRDLEDMEGPIEGGDKPAAKTPDPLPPAVPKPSDQRNPKGQPVGLAEARARLIVEESCARIVQKEISAATKAAAKLAADAKAWSAWCEEFYTEHADFVANVLKITSLQAKTYADGQKSSLKTGGMAITAEWNTQVVPVLVALALGE